MSILAKKRTDLNLNDPAIVAEFDIVADDGENENTTMTAAEVDSMFSDVSEGNLADMLVGKLGANDYITIVKTDEPCNKYVSITKSGEVKKDGSSNITQATATTRHVPDVDSMYALMMELSGEPNCALINGFVAGTEDGTPYQIKSSKQISLATGVKYKDDWVKIKGEKTIGRLKANFQPSSWFQIDRDRAKGLPKKLDPTTEQGYVDLITKILPTFKDAGYVRLATTSGRVIVDGKPLDNTGSRYWFKVDKPSMMDGFGNKLKLWAAANDLGFHKPNKNGNTVLWTICDTSVFSPERLIYDGQPRVEKHERLSLGAPDITVKQGGIVEVDVFPELTATVQNKLKKEFGIDVTSEGGVMSSSNNTQLTLDMPIETKYHGTKTVREFWKSGEERWRCQATIRESSTMNGGLKIDKEGIPYLHDFGGETTYHLSDTEKGVLIDEMTKADTEEVIRNLEELEDPFNVAGIDLTNPPGLAGEICRNMQDMAYRQLPLSYPLTALHVLNWFNAKRPGINGLKLNLITLVMAQTGAGKEVNSKVLAQLYDVFKDRLEPFIGKPRSDVDLIINMVENEGECSYEIDEAHGLFDAINGKNSASYQSAMASEMLLMATKNVYPLAGNHKRQLHQKYDSILGKAQARLTKEREAAENNADNSLLVGTLEETIRKTEKIMEIIKDGIPNPTMNMAMFSTPEKIDSLGSKDSIESGLMGRAMVWRINDPRQTSTRKPKETHLSAATLNRLRLIPESGRYSQPIRLSIKADRLMDAIHSHYEQNRYINHHSKGAMYVRIIERVTSIASILGVESGIVTEEDVLYALAATIRHIDDVGFLVKKIAAVESTEDMVIHLIDLICQRVKTVGEAQSTIRNDVLNRSKPAKLNHKESAKKGTKSHYYQAMQICVERGYVVFENGNEKRLMRG